VKKTSTADRPGVSGSRQQLADLMEARLRALHELIPDAIDFPDLAGPYISFVRSLRERVHPVGTPEIRVVEARSGLKFNVDLGDRLGCDFYYGYLGEAYESEIFMQLVCPGAVIFDVGANFGFYALNAAVRAGKGGVVHAFEPAPAAYRLLCDNVAANGLDNVHSHRVCVGVEDGETDFCVMEESAFSGITPTGRSRLREKITVPLRRLDSIASELGLAAVDALKIDVEGYEFAVLRGARQIIDRSPGLLIQLEVCSKNLDDEKHDALATVLAELYSHDFKGWRIDLGTEGIVECGDADETIRQNPGNVFLVRSGSDAERRLRDVGKALRADAFQDFATRSGLTAEPLLARNPADPHSGLHLHAALLDSVLRDRQGRIDQLERQNQDRLDRLRVQESEVSEWKARFTRTEEDSKQRLNLLRRLEREAAQRKERYELVQRENAARLELIRKLEGQLAEYKARSTEADRQWKARVETVEAESQTRLDLLRQREAEVAEWRVQAATLADENLKYLDRLARQDPEAQKLCQEIDYWKNEGLWARLLRTLRSGSSRSAH